jgi:hypothetical protein
LNFHYLPRATARRLFERSQLADCMTIHPLRIASRQGICHRKTLRQEIQANIVQTREGRVLLTTNVPLGVASRVTFSRAAPAARRRDW